MTMHGSSCCSKKFTQPKARRPHVGATHKYPPDSPMKLLRSDLFRSFGIGFGIVAVTLVMTRFDGAEGLVAILS